jgi:hypothetical protein
MTYPTGTGESSTTITTTTATPVPPPTATTTTTGAEYVENVAAERQEIRPNPALLGTGAILLGGPYVAGAIVAATNSHSYDDKLYYPVAGPWIDLGERPCTFSSRCTSADHWNAALLIADGIAQGAGVVMMVSSAFVPVHKEVIKTAAKPKPHVAVAPVSFKGGGGIGASGTF